MYFPTRFWGLPHGVFAHVGKSQILRGEELDFAWACAPFFKPHILFIAFNIFIRFIQKSTKEKTFVKLLKKTGFQKLLKSKDFMNFFSEIFLNYHNFFPLEKNFLILLSGKKISPSHIKSRED